MSAVAILEAACEALSAVQSLSSYFPWRSPAASLIITAISNFLIRKASRQLILFMVDRIKIQLFAQ